MLTILDALDTPVAILTAGDRIEWVNTAGAAWLGSTPADLAGQTFVELLAPAGRAHVEPLLGRAGAGERSDVEYDGRALTVLPFGGGCALLLGRTPSDHDEQSLATIGHDLRTPLLNLSLAANVLRQSGHDVSVDVGELVAEAGQRLQRLTRDLVDFTRVRLGLERPLSRHAVDVNALARTAIESVHDTFPSTPIELECTPAEGAASARVDPDRTAQLLQNLLIHGLKNRKPRSRTQLSVAVRAEDLAVDLRVPGTSPHDARSFELELVRAGARAHGGSVRVVAPEAGDAPETTRFSVRIPLRDRGEDRGLEASSQ